MDQLRFFGFMANKALLSVFELYGYIQNDLKEDWILDIMAKVLQSVEID